MPSYVGAMPSLTVASWNINSVRARLPIVERFLREHAPDMLCLQETKVENGTFPAALFAAHGYVHQALHGQRMHHGVATLSRLPFVEEDRSDWQANGEARHVGVRLPSGVRARKRLRPRRRRHPRSARSTPSSPRSSTSSNA